MKKFWICLRFNEAKTTWDYIPGSKTAHATLEDAKDEAANYIINAMPGVQILIFGAEVEANFKDKPVEFKDTTKI